MGIITASQGITRIKYKNVRPGNRGNFCFVSHFLFCFVSQFLFCLENPGGSWIPRPMETGGLAEVFCLRFNSRHVPDSSALN